MLTKMTWNIDFSTSIHGINKHLTRQLRKPQKKKNRKKKVLELQ